MHGFSTGVGAGSREWRQVYHADDFGSTYRVPMRAGGREGTRAASRAASHPNHHASATTSHQHHNSSKGGSKGAHQQPEFGMDVDVSPDGRYGGYDDDERS